MTETEWNLSTDPAAMWEYCRDRVTELQMRYFVEACRKECDLDKDGMPENWALSMESWCVESGSVMERYVPMTLRADILRDIVPYKLIRLEVIDRCEYGPGTPLRTWQECPWLTWRDGDIPKMVDEITMEPCGGCGGQGWVWIDNGGNVGQGHCLDCKDTGYVPRAEPQWALLPALADMLEDGAGCREEGILNHLRDPKLKHYKGCFVLELLLK